MDSGFPRRLGLAALFLAIYLGSYASVAGSHGLREAVFWPPTGVAVAGLWILGRRYWPVVALGALLYRVALLGRAPELSLLPASANTVEPWLAVTLLHRFGFRADCTRLRDVLALLVAAAVAPVASAVLGSVQFLPLGFDPAHVFAGSLGW